MLRKLVEYRMHSEIDPDAPATCREDSVIVGEETFARFPELAKYGTEANLEVLQLYFADGKELTINSFARALRDLAAAGQLTTDQAEEAAEARAKEVIESAKQKAEAQKREVNQPRDSGGRFVAADFDKRLDGMTAGQIKEAYQNDRAFREQFDASAGIRKPEPPKPIDSQTESEFLQFYRGASPARIKQRARESAAFGRWFEQQVAREIQPGGGGQ